MSHSSVFWSFLFSYHLTTDAFHSMLSFETVGVIVRIWPCRLMQVTHIWEKRSVTVVACLVINQFNQQVASFSTDRLTSPPEIVFPLFHQNVCLLFVVHHFHFVAWVTVHSWFSRLFPYLEAGRATWEKHLRTAELCWFSAMSSHLWGEAVPDDEQKWSCGITSDPAYRAAH